jgi:diguanylate cyclase (GGDEF)-like protein/PAS domain S-box-containing protein
MQPTRHLTLPGDSDLRHSSPASLQQMVALCADLSWHEDADGVCTRISSHSDKTHAVAQLLYRQKPGELAEADSAVSEDWPRYQRCIAARQPFRQVKCRVSGTEQNYYLQISGVPQFDEQHTFVGYECMAIDMSHEHHSEASLQRFRAAMDMSMDMIYLVDRDTLSFVDVNDTAARAFGFTRDEVLAMGPSEALGQTPEELNERYDRLINQGGSSRIERHVTLKDNKRATIEVFSRAISLNGRWMIIGVSRDISDRKQAENRALHLQHIFSVLSRINEGIIRADSVDTLYQNVCRAAINESLFALSAIITPDGQGTFQGLAMICDEFIELRALNLSTDASSPLGQDLAGSALREGVPQISNDYLNDPRSLPWRERVVERGLRSAAAFPLFQHKQVVAAMMFCAHNVDAFDSETQAVMQNMADNISFALDSFANAEEQARAAALIRESEARFRSLTNLTSDFYWEQDADLRFTKYEGRVVGESNQKAVKTVLGRHLWEMPGIRPDSMNWRQLRRLLKKEQPFRDLEFSFTNEDNVCYHFSLAGEPIIDNDGKFAGYRGISRDITEKKRIADRIKHLATHDTLTGLPNRVMFSELLRQAIRTANRYQDNDFAVMFIDLDRFKAVNDIYGHHTGDALLAEVAQRVRKPLRESDIVARLGGDEFVVLLHKVTDKQYAGQIAENVLNMLKQPIALDEREFAVSGSIGISLFGVDANDEETLMKHADTAMYAAKDDGRNNYRIYSADLHQHTQERAGLALQLRHALERGELSLHYQAKVALDSDGVVGVEALLRWHHPELGDISPVQFIPIAEDNGLIIPIGEWVMETACQQLMAWQAQGLPALGLAVNLSPRQFNHPDLHKHISGVLARTGFAADLLELEITESLVVQNPERAIELMATIKHMGVRFAIDDFGTGYSSLGQLRHYPIDTLKIDRAFIRDLDQSKEDQAISKAIISMGKTLGLTVVAEGVETARQLAFLREHHCDQIQGFYFHRPCCGNDFMTWYRQADLPSGAA